MSATIIRPDAAGLSSGVGLKGGARDAVEAGFDDEEELGSWQAASLRSSFESSQSLNSTAGRLFILFASLASFLFVASLLSEDKVQVSPDLTFDLDSVLGAGNGQDKGGKVKVCVREAGGKSNPRHASIFIRNYLALFGSRLDFHVMPAVAKTLDPYYNSGILERSDLDIKIEACDPSWPTLNLWPHESVNSKTLHKRGAWLMVADEYCLCPLHHCGDAAEKKSTLHQPKPPPIEMRNYFSSQYTSDYIPLGPQFWFKPFSSEERPLASARGLTFNFAGSITNPSRADLAKLLKSSKIKAEFPAIRQGFVKIKAHWTKDLNSNGYVKPSHYRAILLNSTFTLCPQGQNQEAFRIFEAVEAGSIPVIALDRNYYHSKKCQNAFQPLIDSGAPFVYIKSWDAWPKVQEELLAKPAKLDEQQKQLLEWREKFWSDVAKRIECHVLKAHNKQVGDQYKTYNFEDACLYN